VVFLAPQICLFPSFPSPLKNPLLPKNVAAYVPPSGPLQSNSILGDDTCWDLDMIFDAENF